jgi:hypothetical protein
MVPILLSSTGRSGYQEIQPRSQPIPCPGNLRPRHVHVRRVVTPIQISGFDRTHSVHQHITAHIRICFFRPGHRTSLGILDIHPRKPTARVPSKTASIDRGRQARRECSRHSLCAAASQLLWNLRVPDICSHDAVSQLAQKKMAMGNVSD